MAEMMSIAQAQKKNAAMSAMNSSDKGGDCGR